MSRLSTQQDDGLQSRQLIKVLQQLGGHQGRPEEQGAAGRVIEDIESVDQAFRMVDWHTDAPAGLDGDIRPDPVRAVGSHDGCTVSGVEPCGQETSGVGIELFCKVRPGDIMILTAALGPADRMVVVSIVPGKNHAWDCCFQLTGCCACGLRRSLCHDSWPYWRHCLR